MNLKLRAKQKIAWLLLGGILAPAASFAHVPIPPKTPTEIGRRLVNTSVSDFKLTDQDGKPFNFAASHGKLVLVTFVYTTCPDVCPLLTAKFAAIQRSLNSQHFKDYLLITITTDPERDSAPVLKNYAVRFGADLRNWSFLTGKRTELANVWRMFHVNVTKTQSGDVYHTTLTSLIDRRGKRRVDYYGDQWQDKQVLKDFRWLDSPK